MKKKHRADLVPAGPVARALREWLTELDLAGENEMGALSRQGKYFSPYDILSERTGLAEDTVHRHTTGRRGSDWMFFDVADKFLCATDRFHWWWNDPELSEHYEAGCKGADKIYPLKAAA